MSCCVDTGVARATRAKASKCNVAIVEIREQDNRYKIEVAIYEPSKIAIFGFCHKNV